MYRILILLQMMIVLIHAEDKIPYTSLSRELTENLACSFAKTLDKKDMLTNFKMLEIKSSEDILKYMNNEEKSPTVAYAKALILDYMYKSEVAFEFYREAKDLIFEHDLVGYDIAYFLARFGDTDAAIEVLDKLEQIINEYQIAKLKAFVLLANHKVVTNDILFACKKRKTHLRDLQSEFFSCKKKF